MTGKYSAWTFSMKKFNNLGTWSAFQGPELQYLFKVKEDLS